MEKTQKGEIAGMIKLLHDISDRLLREVTELSTEIAPVLKEDNGIVPGEVTEKDTTLTPLGSELVALKNKLEGVMETITNIRSRNEL